MSVRIRAQELVDHVTIRGTCVSTSMIAPSRLHVNVVQSFGLPGRNGNVVCDNHTVYIRYDQFHPERVHVWACQNDSTSDEGICTVS